jgi:hypothetical protein
MRTEDRIENLTDSQLRHVVAKTEGEAGNWADEEGRRAFLERLRAEQERRRKLRRRGPD